MHQEMGSDQPKSRGSVRIASDVWTYTHMYVGPSIHVTVLRCHYCTILDDVRSIHSATPCCSETILACIIRCQFSLSRCRVMLVDRILERARSSSTVECSVPKKRGCWYLQICRSLRGLPCSLWDADPRTLAHRV
jgi:hypothetical protein